MPARQRDSPMSDSMAMSIACPTANELWELAERERERRGRLLWRAPHNAQNSSGEGDTKKVLKNSTFYALIMI